MPCKKKKKKCKHVTTGGHLLCVLLSSYILETSSRANPSNVNKPGRVVMQLLGISSVFIHFTKRQNRLSKHTKDLFTRPFLHHNLPMKVCQHFMYVISMTSCKVPVIQRAAVRRLEDTARSHLQVWYTCQYNQQSHRATTSPH